MKGLTVKEWGRQERFITTECIVANCDYRALVRMLPDETISKAPFVRDRLANWIPSISAFMVHLGINVDIRSKAKYESNVWYYPGEHVDEYYECLVRGELGLEKGFIFYSIPSFHDSKLLPAAKHCIQAILGAPYQPREFWEKDNLKEKIANEMIRRIENFIPGLSQHIEVRQIAIPPTLEKFTGNYLGAMYGWASTVDQIGINDFSMNCPIEGLFFAGHWAGLPVGYSGVPLVVSSGRATAKRVGRFLRSKRKQLSFTAS